MKVIITKQNKDGSFDQVGMINRRLFSHYKTINGALRYACPNWMDPCLFEFFTDSGIYGKPFKTMIRRK